MAFHGSGARSLTGSPASALRVTVLVAVWALLLRALAFVVLGGAATAVAWESEDIAHSLLSGRGLVHPYLGIQYLAYMQPLPPLALAAVYAVLGHSHLAALAFQALCGAALAVATAHLGTSMFSPRAGLVGGLLIAAHPAIVYYDVHNLHPLSLGILTFVLSLGTLWAILRCPDDWRLWPLPGVAIGLATLTRGSLVFLLPLGLAWLLAARVGWRRVAVVGALSSLALGLTLAPWLARNWLLLGSPVMLSTTDMLLWVGHNPNATGGWYHPSGKHMLDLAPPDLMARVRAAGTELGQAAVFREAALAFIGADPLAAVGRTALKVLYFWTFSPYLGATYPPSFLLPYNLLNATTLLLALVGGVLAWRAGQRERYAVLLVVTFCAAETLFRALFYVEGRHRWGVEPAVYLLTALPLVALAPRLGIARRGQPRLAA